MSHRKPALLSAAALAALMAITTTAFGGAVAASDVSVSEPTAVTLDDPQYAPPLGAEAGPSLLTQAADTTAPEADAAEARQCRRLTDFEEDDSAGWFVVNDGVMGGRSEGGGFIADSILRFEGSVVTAGGGFTSARLQLDGDELADSTRIEMRVRPDGRTYGVTLDDAAQYRGRFVSHRADFEIGPVGDDGWAIASVEYDQLVPSIFGLLVDAPQFDPSTAREFGLIIADGIDGDFVLDIDWIDACV